MSTQNSQKLPDNRQQTSWTSLAKVVVRAGLPNTDWRQVQQSGGDPEDPETQQALECLCRAYWHPLFHYAVRRGRSEADAKDDIQAFLSEWIHKRRFAKAQPERGKFRTFLLTGLKHFIIDQFRKERQKRDTASLEAMPKGGAEIKGPENDYPEDDEFYRNWGIALRDLSRQLLVEELKASGKGHLFETFGYLLNEGKIEEAAQRTGVAAGTIRQMLFQWKKKIRKYYREEIARTLEDPTEQDIDQEMLFLADAIRRG